MKRIRMTFTAALVGVFSVTMAYAQTVPVTVQPGGELQGTADVSSIQAQLDELQGLAAELGEKITANADAIAKLNASTISDTPDTPDGTTNETAPDDGLGTAVRSATGGMNLEPVTYYSTAWPFADLAMMSDAWRSDGTGYIYMCGHPPVGEYICTWSGSGSVKFTFGATTIATSTGSVRIRIDAGISGIGMKKSGDVVDLHILPVDWDGSTFHPLYIEQLKPFGVIRFMDWQRTNNAGVRDWATRVKTTDIQATSGGVAIEYMIDLCNQLGADPWFCMPHGATDAYVQGFASLVKQRLNPDRTVYIEWSNEVWNDQFKQGQWLADQAKTTRRTTAWFARWAYESQGDFAIWTNTLGNDRVVRVMGAHLQNPWIAHELAKQMPAGSFDVLSPSAYFGVTDAQIAKLSAATTADDLVDLLASNIQSSNASWYQQHAAISQAAGVDLIAYEGGQHVTPNGNSGISWLTACRELQRSPKIIDLYQQNMQAFGDAGGGMIVAYSYVTPWDKSWGQFGHLEHMDQPVEEAPKYRALIEFAPSR